MKNMIADGYQDKRRRLARRIEKVEAWLAKPELLEADKDAEYAAVIEIDLADIKEPIVCCPTTRTTPSSCPKWPAPRSTKPSSVRA